jgi:N-acyl-L-homoserine lactone synthetase
MSAVALAGQSFSDRLVEFVRSVEYRCIDDDEDREAVFRLRYDAYVREGAIPISFSKRFTDAYDDGPNVWILGTYVDGELASSMRIHVATPENSDVPGMGVFADLLAPEIEKGLTIIDPTRFVADGTLSRLHPELPYATVRLAFLASEYFEADIALATVRAEHQAFYRRILNFKPMCPPRPYPSLSKPISLMSVHFPTCRSGVVQRHPFLQSTAVERAMLFDRIEGVRGFVPAHTATSQRPPMAS